MKIDYDKGVYNIYLSKSRKNLEDEMHISNNDTKIVRELFIKYINKRLNRFILLKQFDKIMSKYNNKGTKGKLYYSKYGYPTWQGFVMWYDIYIKRNIKLNSDYYEIKDNLEDYLISEYPNGNVFVIDKAGNSMSGLWFYINGIKIDLIMSNNN